LEEVCDDVTASTLVGFYSVFVLMQLWNWFAVPLLHVSEASYWLIYGLSMLFGLMTGVGEQDNPAHERRWNALFLILNACVPEQKMEDVKDVRSDGKYMVRFGLADFRQGPFKEPHTRAGLCGPLAGLRHTRKTRS
jgi:hypothetical protein